ncbi:MAG: endonuclease/exonuclease/phosphatase family protein [Bacteroidales bacterium]|nr:endonuclease/exonuclease/phosphatase family protein [Bacteroidales bacterium]
MRRLLRWFYLLVNAFAVIALFCCLFTRFVNPNSFAFFELFGLVFPIIFVANIAISIVWIMAKEHKHNFLFSLIPLLLSLPIAGSYFSAKAESNELKKETEIKVISYNVRDFCLNGWKNKNDIKEKIFKYLENEQPDIICFQEFSNDDQEKYNIMQHIKKELGLKHFYHNQTYTKPPHYFMGNLICSRYPIVNCGDMKFQKTGNSAIWVDIKKGNDTIRIYNSHLESYRLSKENKEQISGENVETNKVKQLIHKMFRAMRKRGVQADEIVESMKTCPYPIISCGDFNSPVCSYTYQHILHSNGFKDAFVEAGYGISSTFDWWPHLRLDYILLDSDFSCRNYKKGTEQLSDHFPISCLIDIEKK